MPYLSTLFDSLIKEKDKLIQKGYIRISNGKGYFLIFQGSNNANSKEKQILKENNPRLDNEDEILNPIDEGSMKKVQKTRRKPKFYYSSKGFHHEKKCFKNNMDIMSWLLKKHNIEVPYDLEKVDESSEHFHSAQLQVDMNYALISRVKIISSYI